MSRLVLSIAVLLLASSSARAAPYVEAYSSTWGQAGITASDSLARVINGELYGPQRSGTNGTSNAGPIGPGATRAFANTSVIVGGVLTTSDTVADLATGTLRSSVQALGGPGISTIGIANAYWSDVVTFNNASGTTLELDLRWLTEGSVTPSTPVGTYGIDVHSSVQVFNTNNAYGTVVTLKDDNPATPTMGGAQFNYGTFGQAGGAYWTFQPVGNNDENSWTTTLLSPTSGLISATLLVPAGTSAIDIAAQLQMDCRNGTLCDYGHTATFSFGALPDGLSWTSDSGVFLTAAVPEGGTLSLFAVGLAALAVLRRRRALGH